MDTTELKVLLSEAIDPEEKVDILEVLIKKYTGISRKKVEYYINIIEKVSLENGYYKTLALVADNRGMFAYFDGDLDKARAEYLNSYDNYVKADSLDLAYVSRAKVGVMYSIEGNYDAAEEVYREVQKLVIPEEHPTALAFLNNNLGTLFHYRGVRDSADTYYDKAIKNYLAIGDSINALRPMGNQAILWEGDDKAIQRLVEIADIRRNLGHKADLLITLNSLSEVTVINNSNYERSQKYAQEAYELSKEVNNISFTISALIRLARISDYQDEKEAALKYANEAKTLAKELNSNRDNFNVHRYFGNFHLKNGNLEKALLEFLEAEKSLTILKESDLAADLFWSMSELYDKLGDDIKAVDYINKSIEVAKETHSYYFLMQAYLQRAKIYSKEGDWNNVLRYTQLARDEEPEGFLGLEKSIYELEALAYKEKGLYKNAFMSLEKEKLIKDSLDRLNNVREMTKKQKDFEFAQEKKIIALEQQQKEAILKAESTQFKIIAFSIGLLGLCILGFLFNSRRQNKIIASANEQLQALNRTKDQLFSIIGHDLKKPVLAFRGITEKLHYLIESGDNERLLEYGKSVEKDALELNNLTDNLLSWALLQKDLVTFKEEKIDLALLADEVVDLFSNVAKEKNIKLSSSISNTSVTSDINAIMTVMRNLVDNALKYTDAGGEVTLTSNRINGKIELSVNDTGQGIQADKIPNLFVLSREKSTEGTSGEKGTGLGLHLVKDLVEKCEGTISVVSELGKGTSFKIALPG